MFTGAGAVAFVTSTAYMLEAVVMYTRVENPKGTTATPMTPKSKLVQTVEKARHGLKTVEFPHAPDDAKDICQTPKL